MAYEWQRDNYVISTDKGRLDIPIVHDFLANRSYWAQGRTREQVERSIQHSEVLGVYRGGAQVGFARLVTDYTTFAWLCDVFITEAERGHGLGKWLVQCVIEHPELQSVRSIMLRTADAHGLYRQFGFNGIDDAERWMVRRS